MRIGPGGADTATNDGQLVACAIATVMPGYGYSAAVLGVVGLASQTFLIGANSTVQIASDPALRGRVMAIYFAIALGTWARYVARSPPVA